MNTLNSTSLEIAFIKMGYREMRKQVLAKPFGCTLVTFEIDKMLFTQWFKGSNDNILVWTSEKINPKTAEEALIQIKNFENYKCRLNIGNPTDSFEFLTIVQNLEHML